MKREYLIKKIYPKNYLNRIQKKIVSLGSKTKIKLSVFLFIKLILLIGVVVFSLAFVKMSYFVTPIIAIAFFYFYDYLFLDRAIKKRIKVLEHDAIFFFQVLALTLQSETNLKMCLKIVSEAIDSELAYEFRMMNKEVDLGKSMVEALENLKCRIPSKDVNNVILNLLESSIYGNSIIDSLNNQIDYLMDKRILEIKASINKMPVKISIVSVLLFIPLILLLIIGPVVINYLK